MTATMVRAFPAPHCPQCGERLQFTPVVIGEEVALGYHRVGRPLARRSRPGRAWACPRCEFIVEANATTYRQLTQ